MKFALCCLSLLASANPFAPATKPAFSVATQPKQDFLEAEPFYDQKTVPTNTYKNKTPLTGKVVSTKRIVGPQATGETCHIIIDTDGDYMYWEGQSMGVVPPGTRDGTPDGDYMYWEGQSMGVVPPGTRE